MRSSRCPSAALETNGVSGLPALPLPILVAAGDDVHLARSVEAERDGDGPIEEVAIVADDKDRALIIGDHFLEEVQRLEVEIVGRLVEHQKIRPSRELAGRRRRERSPPESAPTWRRPGPARTGIPSDSPGCAS
jgi:hypothetical protein